MKNAILGTDLSAASDKIIENAMEFRQVHPETVNSNVLLYGNPKQLIPQYIKDNQVTLAVMGSQGRGYFSEFFLGSVSLGVARKAPSNVLIIPFNKRL